MAQQGACGCTHEATEWSWKRELSPIAAILFLIGLIFNQSLRNTPYGLAEYAVLLPAYGISGTLADYLPEIAYNPLKSSN